MYTQSKDSQFTGRRDEEFSRPVESIMRCEDFKSNFARRLSNRYTTRSPVTSPRQDTTLKLCPVVNKPNEKVPESVDLSSQFSENGNTKQNVAKAPHIETTKSSDIRRIEVNALNTEVETLRWQLSQTEANRQMHIALLQQIVTFLNKVKEHIECQSNESQLHQKETVCAKISPKSLKSAELPRSRSVIHVNKHLEYSLTPVKKINSRKISKSISNVNGFKDCNSLWSQSKLSLSSESEATHKITEEMSRLITLANTVLSTKLPDLFSNCINDTDTENLQKDKETANTIMNFIEENISEKSNNLVLNTVYDDSEAYHTTNKFTDVKDFNSLDHFILTPPTYSLVNDSIELAKDEKEQNSVPVNDSVTNKSSKVLVDKKIDLNNTSNFIEDESGFSSMSSFQEIGIPIISIIPPSPCKEVGYIEEMSDIFHDAEKWKTDSIELDKQAVKVFWV